MGYNIIYDILWYNIIMAFIYNQLYIYIYISMNMNDTCLETVSLSTIDGKPNRDKKWSNSDGVSTLFIWEK